MISSEAFKVTEILNSATRPPDHPVDHGYPVGHIHRLKNKFKLFDLFKKFLKCLHAFVWKVS